MTSCPHIINLTFFFDAFLLIMKTDIDDKPLLLY